LLTGHFSDYAVHHGGDGAGTVIEYQLRGVGRHQVRHVIADRESVAGRMVREPDRTSALVSTWTLNPGGERERMVIRLTVAPRDPHTSGWLGRTRARRALRRLGQGLERGAGWRLKRRTRLGWADL
jgi:uncharacterized protein YjiS (DUF1127 family)